MNRIDSYEDLAEQIVNWIKDYYWDNDLGGLVVGVSGGIDSAVVSTLCARTGLPTYILTMPLDSKPENTELSEVHAEFLKNKYSKYVGWIPGGYISMFIYELKKYSQIHTKKITL